MSLSTTFHNQLEISEPQRPMKTLSRKDSGIDLPTPPPEEELHIPDLSQTANNLTPIDPDEPPLVAVIGVGYVGTHLVETFSRKFNVLGFDVSEKRIAELSASSSTTFNERVTLTSDATALANATHYLVSVPTLLLPNKAIDTSYLRNALTILSTYLRPGATIVIESSVAVGMTRSLVGPLATAKRCFAGMSPERVDPGRVSPPCTAIPKILSGLDDLAPGSLARITQLYSAVFERVVPVSKPEVAEMTKLYENCQRMVCIAYANEMADACAALDISPYEVAEAAATKPFGFMPYAPGVGVGGHCIPVNPYYLLATSEFPLLQAATEKMWGRPAELARRTSEALVQQQQKQQIQVAAKSSSNAVASRPKPGMMMMRRAKSETSVGLPSVLVVGMGFKRGQAVLSNSPGVALVQSFAASGTVNVQFADPLVAQSALPGVPKLAEDEWTVERLRAFDSIIVAVRQTGLDFGVLEQLEGSGVRLEWWC